jgi:hypothetical protein
MKMAWTEAPVKLALAADVPSAVTIPKAPTRVSGSSAKRNFPPEPQDLSAVTLDSYMRCPPEIEISPREKASAAPPLLCSRANKRRLRRLKRLKRLKRLRGK